jgi:pSer/pThr/pTyr-binding forkhead associated (FHA) protein
MPLLLTLRDLTTEMDIHFSNSIITVGTDPCNGLVFSEHDCVNPFHALLFWSEKGWHVADKNSSIGTFWNGIRLDHVPRVIVIGDVIQFGTEPFVVINCFAPCYK